jgi:hypothetical protein
MPYIKVAIFLGIAVHFFSALGAPSEVEALRVTECELDFAWQLHILWRFKGVPHVVDNPLNLPSMQPLHVCSHSTVVLA